MEPKTILLYLMAAFYLFAGSSHFIWPRFYGKVMPPFAKKWKKELNLFVGICEILGGIGLLIPATRSYAAIGILLLLIAVLPVHTYMLKEKGLGMKIPLWTLYARFPIQLVLMAWAIWYI
ncbi:MAG: DoxX family protein [Bacteroidota bacterium]